jgi:aquaporin Z
MKNLVTEFIGTFFLVLTIGLTVAAGSQFAPLAIGCALMIMVYMGGHVSGAHYNPAVTLAVALRGKLSASQVAPYMIVQLAGALVAACMPYVLLGKTVPIAPSGGAQWVQAILVEIVYTFALCLVVLNVATAKATAGNSYYGLAIGFTVVVAAFAGGPISGGAFNPAVGVGLTIIHGALSHGMFDHVWIYLAGPLLGGVLAAMVFKLQNPGDN